MTAVALHEPETQRREVAKLPSVGTGFFDLHSFELTQRVARCLASSTLVPQIYRGNTPEAVGNCMIAINFAQRVKADPLMVMQNLNVIQGRPSWGSPFLIALVNACGRFTEMEFEFLGEKDEDSYGCRAIAASKASGRVLTGADITIKMAKDEGWYGRNGSKWRTMPQQMLIYRAAAFWARVYAPEVSMGLLTQDEAEDIIDLEPSAYREVAPAKGRSRPRPAVPANDVTTIENEETPPDEPRLSATQVAALLTLATEVGADTAKVCEWAGVTTFNDIPASSLDRVRKALEAKRRKAAQAMTSDFSGADSNASSAAAEAPAQGTGAGDPPSSPPTGDAGNASSEAGQMSPVEEARQAGREACEAGIDFKDIPAKYTKYTSYRKAWEQGYQAQAEEMGA